MGTYYVAMINNPAHPFSTYVIGEFVSEDENKIVLRSPCKAMEMPTEQGVRLSFLVDHFLTVDSNSDLGRSNVVLSRLLDPEMDLPLIKQIEGFYATNRAKRTGIALPPKTATSLVDPTGRNIR